MNLKYILEKTDLRKQGDHLAEIFASSSFLKTVCAAIFLISILLRSTLDIGSDSGVYLMLGKKIAEGGKYYYNFFESNFPISFYFYALQYKIASFFGFNRIIFAEVVINLLGVLSIIWSARILKKTTIYDDKLRYNLVIISYFLGFFLRPFCLEINEFLTKTSLLLIVLFPYLAYSFERKISLTFFDKIKRGILMGIIPCIKPHYLFFSIFIESFYFLKQKKLSFFFDVDKLIMYLVGAIYLLLMLKYTPEFFEFIVLMWPKVYQNYDNISFFYEGASKVFINYVIFNSFMFLVLTRLKLTENYKILLLFYIASSVLIIVESISARDQVVIFYAIAIICFWQIVYDSIKLGIIPLFQHKFLSFLILIWPIFDIKRLPITFLNYDGPLNFLWIAAFIYPFIAKKEIKKIFDIKFLSKFYLFYFIALSTAFILAFNFGRIAYWFYAPASFMFVLYLFEKNIYSRFSKELSPVSTIMVLLSFSYLFYSYAKFPLRTSFINLHDVFAKSQEIDSDDTPQYYASKMQNIMAHYIINFAPDPEDSFVSSSKIINSSLPISIYLNKPHYYKPNIFTLDASYKKAGDLNMVSTKDLGKVFTATYILEDFKNQLRNPHNKILFFFNNETEFSCIINDLEYYLLDPGFKKLFLENYRFENRVIITKKSNAVRLILDRDPIYKIKPSERVITYDVEVYVRKNS